MKIKELEKHKWIKIRKKWKIYF